MKVINKKKFVSMGGKVEQMFTEVTVMDKLSHPNIVDIRNVYDTPSYLVLVLELYEQCHPAPRPRHASPAPT